MESQRHTIQGDYIGTMDELADLVGVKPNLLSLAFTDPKTGIQLFGDCTPIQYRLQGPGKWDGARKSDPHDTRSYQEATNDKNS